MYMKRIIHVAENVNTDKTKTKTLLVFYWGRVIIGCQKLTAWWGNGVETHLDKKKKEENFKKQQADM